MRMVKTTIAVLTLFTAMVANTLLFAAEETVASGASARIRIDTESVADDSAKIDLGCDSSAVKVAYSARAWDASAAMQSCSLYDNGVLVSSFDGEGEYSWSPSYGTHELSLSVEGGETLRREFFRDYPSDFVIESSSSPMSIDTRADGSTVLEAKASEPIRYSSLWAADANATATVTLNGAPFAGGKGEGVATWTPTAAGTYTFQHTTEGRDDVLTATFSVTAKTDEETKLHEIFDDKPVTIEPDGDGGWIVTITNDIDAADLPIEIPDNIGNVTIDLNGYDLGGHDEACPSQAIVIVKGEGDGEPTVLTIVTGGGDATVQGGEGAPAIEVAEDAQEGVIINIGEGVTVQGGDEYTPAIIGEVGVNEGTIVEPSRIHIPGEGTVTTPKSWKAGQKVTWKAKAAKGSVFARWEGELVESLGLSRNERRNPSLQFIVPSGFDTNQVSAVFISIDDDGLSKLSFVDGDGEPMGDEDGILFELKSDVGEFWLADDSESYVTASVSGLPPGLKFDKKTMRVTGAPTKSGVYWAQIKAKNASGYQWSEKVRMAVSGYTTEPKEPTLKRTAYYPLTVVSSDAAAGTVSSTGVYAEGKKASISAKPAKGHVFAGWYRDAALTEPMQFASGDYRKASQSVVVPEVRYLFARFVAATAAGDPITGLAAKGSGLVAESRFKWCVGVAVPEGDGVEYVSASLPSASAAKLPPGVKFDAAKGCFTGVPTKAGEYEATVTVKNASKATDVLGLTIDVAALPAWAQGTFCGSVKSRVESEDLAGTVSLTVSAVGKVSGKAQGDGIAYTLAAPSYSAFAVVSGDDGLVSNFMADVTASWSYKEGSKTVKTNDVVRMTVRNSGIGGIVTGGARPVAPESADATERVPPFWTAWQYNWKVEPWKTLGKSFDKKEMAYAILFDGTFSENEKDLTSALGADVVGRVALKFKANGTASVSGEFVSGYDDKAKRYKTVKASGSATLVPVDDERFEVFVYLLPKGLPPHGRCLSVR